MAPALILANGPRGHHESVVALAVALVNTSTFDVLHLVLQEDFLHIVPFHARIIPHVLPYGQHAISRLAPSIHLRRNPAHPFAPVDLTDFSNRHTQAILAHLVIPSFPFVHHVAIAVQPIVVISTPLSSILASTLAEHLSIPHVRLHFLPITPTTRIPHPLAYQSSAAHAAALFATLRHTVPSPNPSYITSYVHHNYRIMSRALPLLNRMRERLDLPPLSPRAGGDTAIASGRPGHVINAYSCYLAPRIPDWLSCVHCVSPFSQDYVPTGWRPDTCPQLAMFLARCARKPFVFTLSLAYLTARRRRTILNLVLSALRAAEIAPVIYVRDSVIRRPGATRSGAMLRGGSTLTEETNVVSMVQRGLSKWVRDNVLICDEMPPLPWLFPQCDGLICDGNGDTVWTALRAAIPIVVVPCEAEQVFWGRLVAAASVGAVVAPDGRNVSKEGLSNALRRALSKPVRGNVCRAAAQIRALKPGADHAAEIIGRIVHGERYNDGDGVAGEPANAKSNCPAWSAWT